MACARWVFLSFAVASSLPGQTATDLKPILDRLERLEAQNRSLLEEMHQLREQLAGRADGPPIEERLAVQEQRTEDQAQTKVEASQRMPIELTGTLLFNVYANGSHSGTSQDPVVAGVNAGKRDVGASLRQTLLGVRFHGPEVFGGGKVSGSLMMDFFGGSGEYLSQLVRLRTASVNIDWKTRSLMIGQDKPIIAPRDPTSLAQVGVSPLTGAGNLWLWQPQIRFEQRVGLGEEMGLRLQAGVYQTSEGAANIPAAFLPTLEESRPALQGRFEFWRAFAGGARTEVAPGFHASTTHVAGTSVPSRAASVDWLIRPVPKFEFTGTFYRGENLANMGAVRQGFTILGPGRAIAVRGTGGWAQLSYTATKRLSFNLFGGQHDDRRRDLRSTGINKNQDYGANAIYRIAPNILMSLEASQVRTTFVRFGDRLNNHYDLALAYLF